MPMEFWKLLTRWAMPFSGYPMAKNLRAKLPPTDDLIVHDKNVQATSSFAQEMAGSNVEVASSVREVAEKSVCASLFRQTRIVSSLCLQYDDEFDFLNNDLS